MKQEKIIPIFLSDLYGTINSSPIHDLVPWDNPNQITFMKGDDIANFISANRSTTKNKIITFVIGGLIDVYWERRDMLSDEIEYLKNAIFHPQPTFDLLSRNAEMSLYEMDGNITPYNVIYITVDDFIKSESIFIRIPGINIIIQIE